MDDVAVTVAVDFTQKNENKNVELLRFEHCNRQFTALKIELLMGFYQALLLRSTQVWNYSYSWADWEDHVKWLIKMY